MADGKVEYKFLADTQQAERNMARLEKRLDDQDRKLKQVSRTSRRSASQTQTSFQAAMASAGKAAASYLSVGTAIGVMAGSMKNYTARVGEATAAQREFKSLLGSELLFTGDLPKADDVEKFLSEFRGLTRKQSLAAFGGVTGGAPALELPEREAIAKNVERLAPVLSQFDENFNLQGAEKIRQFAAVAGKFAKLAEGRVENAADIVDLALIASQEAGDVANQLTSPSTQKAIGSLVNGGVSFRKALAVAAEALEETGQASGLNTIASKLDPAQGITFDALLADQELARKTLGDRAFAEFRKLNPAEIAVREKRIEDAFRRDLVGEQVRFAAQLDPSKFVRQQTAAERDQQLREEGNREANLAAQAALQINRESQFTQSIPGIEWLTRQGLRIEDAATSFRGLFTGEEGVDFQQRSVNELRVSRPDIFNVPAPARAVDIGGPAAAVSVGVAPGGRESEQLMRDTLDELRRQGGHHRAIARRWQFFGASFA